MPHLTEAQINSIADALRARNKIDAIKLYREATGFGLKESKDEVEAIEAGLRTKFPEQFPAKAPAGKGCLGVLILGLTTTVAGVGWWISQA